jgi:hypothetical protein
VVVIGDLLRPAFDDTQGGVDKQTSWLFHAIRRQVHLACGLNASVLTSEAAPEIMALLTRLRPSSTAKLFWARHFHDAPAELEAALVARLRGCFCVCYEMPPYLGRLLDRHGIGHIDLRVHPVRFMDDLLFAARCSNADVQRRLVGQSVSHTEVLATIGLREAMLDLVQPARMPPDTLLVLGQQRWDSSQIASDGFFDPEARIDVIERLCGRHQTVAIKPHPNGADGPLIEIVQRLRPDAVVAEDNVYRLLSCPNVAAVLSVNSSVAIEAELFGKPSHTLAPQPIRASWRGDALGSAYYASVDDFFLTTDFWRMVLQPHIAVTALDGERLPAKPNRLRLALGAFWNFQQIDTDLIPRPAPVGITRATWHTAMRLKHAGRSMAAALSAMLF